MNIFAELIHAVYDFKSYPVFRRNKGGKAFLYGLLLSVFYLLLSMLLPMLVTLVSFGGFGNVVRQSIPDFRLEDGDSGWTGHMMSRSMTQITEASI